MEKNMPVRWYSGTTKKDAEAGFERLNSNADRKLFSHSCQSPENQGWRGDPEPMYGVAIEVETDD